MSNILSMSYYETLHVSPNACEEVISWAYKALMRKYHPDLNGNDAKHNDIAQKINLAYEVLKDPTRRAAYDRDLKRQENARKVQTAPRSEVKTSSRVKKYYNAYSYGEDCFTVKFPAYREDFTKELKRRYSRQDVSYKKSLKAWVIADDLFDEVNELTEAMLERKLNWKW